METQRLITVSLGKIAQSRGQRGGINLHKNLLVATVLHKARTAYMIESYSYQQSLHRQHQQIRYQPEIGQKNEPPSDDSNQAGVCLTWCGDSNLGQPDATPTAAEQSVSDISTSCEPDHLASLQSQHMDSEVVIDKENSPPADNHLDFNENVQVPNMKSADQVNHLSAANQLSQESQSSESNSKTTCKVLKRRRTNRTSRSDCPASKKAKVSSDASSSPVPPSDHSDYSDDSDIEAEVHESPQISNLVSIFNSGFSGLCAITGESGLNSSNYQSDLDVSSSQSQLSLNKLRPETPSAFSRMVADSSLSCSSQVNRLDTLPSAIVLSA